MKILNIYTVISLNKKYFQYPRYKTVLPIKLNENQLDENWFWNGIIYRFARVHLSADIDEMELREGRLICASSQEEQLLPSVTACRHFFRFRPFHPLTQCVCQVVDLRFEEACTRPSRPWQWSARANRGQFKRFSFRYLFYPCDSRNSRVNFFFCHRLYAIDKSDRLKDLNCDPFGVSEIAKLFWRLIFSLFF